MEEYDEYLSGFNEGFSSSFNDYTGVIITAKILINYENIYNQKFEEILEIKFPLKQDFDKMLRNYKFDRE
ncbi:hypothetical protein MMP66_13075 [Acinetobacter dispersus]|uniref:hypothetical protein n=1 Tax=Acinetobacter dispersus TaxID=70348 RepID=UPI001F4AEABF|nr:hypothetical protein [Acinetobacter dispersus]MCH7395193.1 hypothetical protein [Acinetobacter dispersus]